MVGLYCTYVVGSRKIRRRFSECVWWQVTFSNSWILFRSLTSFSSLSGYIPTTDDPQNNVPASTVIFEGDGSPCLWIVYGRVISAPAMCSCRWRHYQQGFSCPCRLRQDIVSLLGVLTPYKSSHSLSGIISRVSNRERITSLFTSRHWLK